MRALAGCTTGRRPDTHSLIEVRSGSLLKDEMYTFPLILADGVTIKLGDNVWTFGLNFIIYLIVAAVAGLVAESLVGRRLPFGFIGAIIAALVGAWLLTKVIVINGIGDINIFGVPFSEHWSARSSSKEKQDARHNSTKRTARSPQRWRSPIHHQGANRIAGV